MCFSSVFASCVCVYILLLSYTISFNSSDLTPQALLCNVSAVRFFTAPWCVHDHVRWRLGPRSLFYDQALIYFMTSDASQPFASLTLWLSLTAVQVWRLISVKHVFTPLHLVTPCLPFSISPMSSVIWHVPHLRCLAWRRRFSLSHSSFLCLSVGLGDDFSTCII